MERRIGRLAAGVMLIVAWGGVASASAAGWADALFEEHAHDFGPVPRGAKVTHKFVLRNTLAEPVTIVDLRASCGCTTGRASASMVPPGGAAVVEATMDTRNFAGHKATVLTVALMAAGGKQGEARLHVSSNILADIVLNPGSLDFGVVARGQAPRLSMTVERLGAPDWRAVRMVSASKAIDFDPQKTGLVETSRSAGGVVYTLTVALKPDAPSGVIRDEVRIVTNDRESPAVPVLVTAQVQGELSATPAVLTLGRATSKAALQGRFLVRSTRPFAITAIEGAGDGFQAAADDATRKPIHVVTVQYRPDQGTTRGDLRRVFRVATDLPGEAPLDLTATLRVDP